MFHSKYKEWTLHQRKWHGQASHKNSTTNKLINQFLNFLVIEDMLIKTRCDFLPITFMCQGLTFLHFLVCSRTCLPFCCWPRPGRAELLFTQHMLSTIFFPQQSTENLQKPDTTFDPLGWKGGAACFPLVLAPVGGIPAPSFLLTRSLLSFIGTLFHGSSALCWTKLWF